MQATNETTCQQCNGSRMLMIDTQCVGQSIFNLDGCQKTYYDQIPNTLNIGTGKNINLIICANCGHVNGTWPLPHEAHITFSGSSEESTDDSSEESDDITTQQFNTLIGEVFEEMSSDSDNNVVETTTTTTTIQDMNELGSDDSVDWDHHDESTKSYSDDESPVDIDTFVEFFGQISTFSID